MVEVVVVWMFRRGIGFRDPVDPRSFSSTVVFSVHCLACQKNQNLKMSGPKTQRSETLNLKFSPVFTIR